jgi:gamma-glutamyl-gamma-aminobutyrate hydrolase PuuD
LNIGLSQRVLYHRGRAYDAVEQSWYGFLSKHNIVVVANTVSQDFAGLAQRLDCLILTGGDDSALRRTVELKLASQMLLLRRPVLGVCHGAFLLTSILGGTVTTIDNHSDSEHDVWYHGTPRPVNSYHNLAIAQTHSTATVLATDQDLNVEAWIDGLTAGIVWHPERMSQPWIPLEIEKLMDL